MADSRTLYVCPSLVVAWQQYMTLAYYEAYVQAGEFGLPITGEIVEYQGRWAIQLRIEASEDTNLLYTWLAADSPAELTVDVRLLMMQAGFSTASVMNWNVGDASGIYPSYDILFSQLVEDTKSELITTCTDGEIVFSSTDAIDSGDGHVHSVMSTMVVKNASAMYVTTDRGTAMWTEVDPEFAGGGGPAGVDAFQTQPAAGIVGSFPSLVDAVNEITNQDIETTANQGAFGWSLKAKVAVGT